MITQTAEYALRAIVYLAGSDAARVKRSDIAEATQIPQDYLTKVLKELDHAGLVQSRRGPGGGYRLMQSAEEMSVFDVIIAVSALPRIETCPLGIKEHVKLCPLHKKLDEAAELVEKAYREASIAELIPKRPKSSDCQFPRET